MKSILIDINPTIHIKPNSEKQSSLMHLSAEKWKTYSPQKFPRYFPELSQGQDRGNVYLMHGFCLSLPSDLYGWYA